MGKGKIGLKKAFNTFGNFHNIYLTNIARAFNIIIARAKMKRGDSMSPAGRPPKENPRNINLNIRLTAEESKRIQACADELMITRTDTIMKGIELVEKELNKK